MIKLKKKILAVSAALLVLCTAAAGEDYKTQYPWAAEAVSYCIRNDILRGDADGNLMLGDSLTQAQAASLLVRTFDFEPLEAYGRKKLIEDSHWAAAEVADIGGYIVLPGEFEADEDASREMFVSTLVSVLGLETRYDASVLKENFRDCSKVRLEYIPFLASAYKNNLMKGSGGRINPKDSLTRAEAVTLIYRALNGADATDEDIPAKETPAPVPPDETPAPEPAEEAVITTHTPLIGAAQVTAEQAKAWARAKGAHQRYIDIADTYWKYGELTGIRADILYAQAGKETGYGNYTGRVLPEMNNWAGIKKYGAVGDETEDHETFETPDDGVRGHFNHICAYVGLEPIGTPHGRYNSVKSLAWAGTITEAEQLGGKWCPDPMYGADIVKMAEDMTIY